MFLAIVCGFFISKLCSLVFLFLFLVWNLHCGYNRANDGSHMQFIESSFPGKVAYGFYHIRNVNQVLNYV